MAKKKSEETETPATSELSTVPGEDAEGSVVVPTTVCKVCWQEVGIRDGAVGPHLLGDTECVGTKAAL